MELKEAKLVISNSRELIPINNGLVNFQTDFNITSKGKSFRAVIINQESLDNPEDIVMKNVPKGVFAGRIIKNSGKKEDWYIAVESDEQIEADLSINTIEIEEEQDQEQEQEQIEASIPPKKKRISLWVVALIIGIILIIGYVLYKFLLKKKPSKTPSPVVPQVAAPIPQAASPLPKEQEKNSNDSEDKESVSPSPRGKKEVVESEEEELDIDFSDLPPV